MYNPRISFTINDRIFTATAQIVEQDKEPELTGEVSKLMNTKYGWNDDGLIVQLIYH
jgi:hypothetical protein